MNPTSKAIYTPPRPNLGPEAPLAESPPWFGLGVGLALAGVGSAFLLRRRRRRKPTPPTTKQRPGVPEEGSVSPHERMIAWSLSIRESMADAFGSAWLAKTTEEIANDSTLVDAIGPEPAERLIAFLAEADRAKFANSLELLSSTVAEAELHELINIIAQSNPKPSPHI